MPHRPISFFIFAGAILYASGAFFPKAEGQVLGADTIRNGNTENTDFPIQVKTITAFDQKEDVVVEEIPYEVEYQNDPDVESGTEEILEPGETGTRTKTYLVTSWDDEEIDRQLIDTKIEEPKTEVVSK